MRFQIQKYEKYLESKKDLKMPQGPLNKEFLSNLSFLNLFKLIL